MIISVQKAVEAPGECWDDWKFFLEWGKRIDPDNWPWENEKEMVLWRVNELYGMNILVPSEPAEPGFGATAMRSSLCKIEAGRGDL